MRLCLKFIEDVLRLAHPLHLYTFGLSQVAAQVSYGKNCATPESLVKIAAKAYGGATRILE